MADVNDVQQHEETDDNYKDPSGKDHFFNGLETLVVDNILDARQTKNCRQYLVSFKSWIAEDYLQDYHNLLQDFWQQRTEIKDDNDDKGNFGDEIENGIEDGPSVIENGLYKRVDSAFCENDQDEDVSDNGNGFVDDEYDKEDSTVNIEFENNPEETFEQNSEELLPPYRPPVREPYDHRENSLGEEDKENDDTNNVTSSTSSESLEVNVLKESNPSKKRKLKTLDDIVRKITKSNDGVIEPHYNYDEDVTGRLITLDQTLGDGVKNEEETEQENSRDDELTKTGAIDNNIYWSGGKAYQKNSESNDTEKQNTEGNASEKPLPSQQVKSRQRYQKCRFCSTLYSDPALLERHENSHFIYKSRHGINFHDGIPPPPLVPVVENRREFPQYQHENSTSPNHLVSPQQQQQQQTDDSSIVRKPIRNLLSKLYENDTREKYEQPWLSPDASKRPPSPGSKQNSPKNFTEENKTSTTCPICKRRFDNFEIFEQHFESHHPGVSKYVCKVCYEVFLSQQRLEAHSLTHTELDYVCRFCATSFDQKDDYEAHLLTHSQEKPFRCHICGRSFSLRTNLRRHLLVHSDVTPFFCHACGIGFRRPDALSAHMKEHHLAANGHIDSHVKHQRVEGDSNNYPSIYERRHSDGHHSNPLHTSPRQMEHSPSRSSNASHDSNEHQHYEPVKMLQPAARYYKGEPTPAGYPYDSAYSPNHHQNNYKPSPKSPHMVYREGADPNIFFHQPRNHSGELYDTAHHIKLQQRKRRTYSPIKPNPMKMVPPPATQPQHHVTGGGFFECLKCSEKFSSPSLYDIHVQSHKEVFECEKCHKSFAVRSQYDVHVQSHDNSKSHKCPYCHRSFSMKGNLRRHIRIHTNEAPYECPICFQRFRRSDGLKGHIRRHETLGETAPTDLLPSQAS